MRVFIIAWLLLLLAKGCTTKEEKVGNDTIDNTLPMYGETDVLTYGKTGKTESHLRADQKFIEDAVKKYGSLDSASKVHVTLGWIYLQRGDTATAMKRFNQAWLLNPENADCYWAFGIVTGMRGDDDEAAKLLRRGWKFNKKHRDINLNLAFACMKQFVRDKPVNVMHAREATIYLEQIVDDNPNDTVAIGRLAVASFHAGNVWRAKECVHHFEELTKQPFDSSYVNAINAMLKEVKKQTKK